MKPISATSRSVMLAFGMLFVAPVLFEAVIAQAATYYVALTGNDSNPGTLTQPVQSITRGVSLLKPGDTLYLRGGTYTERIDLATANKTGAENAWITVAGYPGETVIIRYTSSTTRGYGPIRAWGDRGYFIFENFVLDGIDETDGTKWQIAYGNHHFTLRNIEIKNFKSSSLYIDANDVLITNCSFHDGKGTDATLKRFYGIYAHSGNNIIIENSDIYNQPGGGVHLYPGPFKNLIVRGNRVHHNSWVSNSGVGGIILYGSSTAPATNVEIYNNVVFKNGAPTSGRGDGILISKYTVGTKVWNNTVFGNKSNGIRIGFDTTTVNTVVQNNIMYGNAGENYGDDGANTTYDHNLTTDPKFVKSETFDFRLQAHSPAIDAGLRLNEVPLDIRKVPRPQGATHDIGAYEEGVSASESPDPPRNLSFR